MRRLLTLVLLLLSLPASGADLGVAFDRVVFGTGQPWARERLIRVAAPALRFEVYGVLDAAEAALLDRHVGDLAAATGLAVGWLAAAQPAPPVSRGAEELAVIQVHLVPRSAFAPLLEQSWIPAGTRASHARALCAFVTLGRDTVRAGLVLIDADLPAETVRHCLIEETAQALGAFDDTTLLDPSGFNDWGGLVERLQPADLAILRALYDPRLAPGMARAEVLALLPAILAQD
jgi:hypothetical protein